MSAWLHGSGWQGAADGRSHCFSILLLLDRNLYLVGKKKDFLLGCHFLKRLEKQELSGWMINGGDFLLVKSVLRRVGTLIRRLWRVAARFTSFVYVSAGAGRNGL